MSEYIDKVFIYADGGCKPNPGIMVGSFLITDGTNILTGPKGKIFGPGTNVLAEFRAISLGLDEAVSYTRRKVVILCDNKFVIEALRKDKRIHKDHLKAILIEIYNKTSMFEEVEYIHVSEKNKFIKKCDEKCAELFNQLGGI